MESQTIILLLTLVAVEIPGNWCYHDPTAENVPYHCWWNNASAVNPDPISCQGISISWGQEPPHTVGLNEKFNVSYGLEVEDSFYSTMFGFAFDEYQRANISAPENLKLFCNSSSCPSELVNNKDSFRVKCCVWHANIHVCHPTETCGTTTSFCGPWVDNDQQQSTHTIAVYGNINDLFTAEVDIREPGKNYLIAHIKLGNIQLAIQTIILVNYCGDDKCTNGETCDNCPKDCCNSFVFPSYAVIIIVMSCLVFLLLPIFFVVCFCYRRRKLFYDESWIIDSSRIKRFDQSSNLQLKDGISSLVSIHTMLLYNKSQESEFCNRKLLNSFNPSKTSLTSETRHYDIKHYFTQTGLYEGRRVAIKKTPRKQILLNNQIRSEVMKVRALDHPNLCRFIGATVVNPSIVSEYCPKGSLSDVLQNEDVPLNWGFRLSFATDVARGMAYLHSKRIYHERLCSNNCVIDDRWAVKISDYGLSSFRAAASTLSIPRGNAVLNCTMYQAPEKRIPGITMPTAAGDVYSFSIILFEISTRINPSKDELFVDPEGRPKLPLLKNEDCPCTNQYLELMKQCWDLLPTNRPTFDQVKKSLYKMNPCKESPVDMMMIMMEKYSNHLEQLVADRTQELIIEQLKTSNLLYSMLPRQVADELRHGRHAAAQSFKSATIFFSDIVGFTSLAGGSTPMQVVNMLNELYSLFDDILDTFDVYKVETIGDAYMVVSGVPTENGNRHAEEIAKMALKLLAVTEAFKIPHRPGEKLKIRVGIHSGSVCAGVVGLKMPRYCLFGDTVNTASRMESTSEAMKVQCSDVTHKLLLKHSDSFTFECRGQVEMKGKGFMTTWWLAGHKQTMAARAYSTQLLKLSPTSRQRSMSSISSADIMGSPNLSYGMKHPFSCSPLPKNVLSPRRSHDILPISVTNYNNKSDTILNIDTDHGTGSLL